MAVSVRKIKQLEERIYVCELAVWGMMYLFSRRLDYVDDELLEFEKKKILARSELHQHLRAQFESLLTPPKRKKRKSKNK